MVNVETVEELLELASNAKPIDLLMVYTESLLADCKEVKDRDALSGLPLLALAKFGAEELQAQVINAGALDYLDLGNSVDTVVEARVRNYLQLSRISHQLAEIARVDPLTNIYNRYYFDEAIDTEWRRCCREFNALSMIMIDIDAFTTFNEHYGVGVGDNCLKRIATVIENNCLRAADVVSRYDSDEFVVLLPGTEFENAMRVAENICRAVSSLHLIHEYSDCAETVTVSVGIGTVDPTQDQEHKVFVQEVEEILHRAQQQGGNQAQGVEL